MATDIIVNNIDTKIDFGANVTMQTLNDPAILMDDNIHLMDGDWYMNDTISGNPPSIQTENVETHIIVG